MTSVPSHVRIRMYNVGFGDCFLLTFAYPDEVSRHVLVDFGTMGLPKRDGERLHGTADVARQIAADCGTEGLTAVVATHRHQDHISGFAGRSGVTIEQLEPGLVMQPWTEQPDLPEHATSPTAHRNTARRFMTMNDDLEQHLSDHGLLFVAGTERGGEHVEDDFDLDQLGGVVEHYGRTARSVAQNGVRDIIFLGNNNIKNWDSVERLATMGHCHEYLRAGERTSLSKRLPGATVHVLGPPTADDVELGVQASKHDTEFWHMARSAWGVGLRGLALGDEAWGRFDPMPNTPVECRWLASHIRHARPRDLLAIVRDLDDALNNTSLILLFEVWSGADRKLLLFSGDAQIESWNHCFENPETVALLEDVDVYKVGHHGSLNATPKKSLWGQFCKQGPEGALVTLLSTCDDRHGHRENETEVPRRPLVHTLRCRSELIDTRSLAKQEQPMFEDHCVLPGTAG